MPHTLLFMYQWFQTFSDGKGLRTGLGTGTKKTTFSSHSSECSNIQLGKNVPMLATGWGSDTVVSLGWWHPLYCENHCNAWPAGSNLALTQWCCCVHHQLLKLFVAFSEPLSAQSSTSNTPAPGHGTWGGPALPLPLSDATGLRWWIELFLTLGGNNLLPFWGDLWEMGSSLSKNVKKSTLT